MNAPAAVFSPKRLGLLLLNDLVLDGKGMLTAAAAVAAVAALFWGVLPVEVTEKTYSGFLFPVLLTIGGLVVSSRAYKKSHLPGFGVDYLMVPAPTLEKFVSRLLMTGVGYSLGVALLCVLLSLLILAVRAAFGRGVSDIYNPLTLSTLVVIANYLVFNAVFVCGSLYFSRHALVKTALVLGLFMLAVGMYTSVLGANVFRDIGLEGWLRLKSFTDSASPAVSHLMNVARYGIFYATAPLFWVAGYYRLRELEV